MKASRAALMVFGLGSLAALPACSMLGMHSNTASSSGGTSAPASTAATPMPPPMTSSGQPVSEATIKQVQTSLKQQGLYKGRIDGMWGPETQEAVKDYQQKNNLTASGELDDQTLRAMNIATNSSGNMNNNMSGGSNMNNMGATVNNPASMSNGGTGNMGMGSNPASTNSSGNMSGTMNQPGNTGANGTSSSGMSGTGSGTSQ